MATQELELKKNELIRNILNQPSEDIIDRLNTLYKILTTNRTLPSQPTEEEMLSNLRGAAEAMENDELISHTEIKRKRTT